MTLDFPDKKEIGFEIDGALLYQSLAEVPRKVRELDQIGYDGFYLFEGPNDVFLPCVLAAEHTAGKLISTQVAVAFARNPLSLAYQANDLQMLSEGHFLLGLGTQAQQNIEKRYSMPWGKPVSRMREMVSAIKAIYDCWNNDTPLDFRGEFYTHTKMQPMFRPPANPYGAPPVMLGGIGSPMTRLAGEIADWFVVIPYHTPAFLEQVTFPALKQGLETGGRKADNLNLTVQCMVATGLTEESFEQAKMRTRNQIAFYGSTPIYKKALEAEGWGDFHTEWLEMSRTNRWSEMADTVPDDMLEAFAVVGEPQEITQKLIDRFGSWADRVSLMTTYLLEARAAQKIVLDLKSRMR